MMIKGKKMGVCRLLMFVTVAYFRPMEEQRQRYGPSLYSLTKMVLAIHLFLLLSWGRFGIKKLQQDQLSALQQAVQVYTSELEKFIKFIG
ncbi:hypothetical protein AXF42_Ash021729 [Apostasia shenzhenica]|uniref:Uncharacterized protein n=1 Tax=Apostasia shenzhenica TaxID=1088818 RepID=A0A2H9ZRY5_9ASPA|nr:hypothetical protein AXF42_Ash021729 [Apostasia shenzhenica]